jgi:hypothetical protein
MGITARECERWTKRFACNLTVCKELITNFFRHKNTFVVIVEYAFQTLNVLTQFLGTVKGYVLTNKTITTINSKAKLQLYEYVAFKFLFIFRHGRRVNLQNTNADAS